MEGAIKQNETLFSLSPGSIESLLLPPPLTSEGLCVFLFYDGLHFGSVHLLGGGVVFLILVQHHLHPRVVFVVVPHVIIIVIVLQLQPTLTLSCRQHQSALQTPGTPGRAGLLLYRERNTNPAREPRRPQHLPPSPEWFAEVPLQGTHPFLPNFSSTLKTNSKKIHREACTGNNSHPLLTHMTKPRGTAGTGHEMGLLRCLMLPSVMEQPLLASPLYSRACGVSFYHHTKELSSLQFCCAVVCVTKGLKSSRNGYGSSIHTNKNAKCSSQF